MKKIGFIGVGNMGGAMAKACARIEDAKVYIFDVNESMYAEFKKEHNIQVASNIEVLMQQCDYVVMSVKPQYYQIVGDQIKGFIKKEQIIVTVAPSYTVSDMKELLGSEVKVIRTMPNTPALVGQGVTAYCYNEMDIQSTMLVDFEQYFESFGKLIKVDEHLMPAIVAATGSSPAYVYMFIEAMADAAVSFGMPRAVAYEVIAQTVKGSAQMVVQTGKHPGELKDAVTSPGGTTIKAVLAMEESGFRNSVIKGMEACHKQVIALSDH
ncbi:MAG: pyrroline-5-carboxylate reductase [Cellulosilyticum sp.]|nr:pyrroline-5-carboxylate reductase [Cellulosilyticum sp.]